MTVTAPYGTWRSSITADRIASGSLRLSQPRLDRGTVYWLEGRPAEGGRQVVVRARPGSAPEDVTPASVNVRTRVHEYGGGDYFVRDGIVHYVDFRDQSLWRLDSARGAAAAQVAAGASTADFDLSPDGRWLAAVEERPRAGAEPENRIVAFARAGANSPRVVDAAHDFVSFPRFSPDGRWLAYTAWDHPNMPWDGTRLYLAPWGPEGPAGTPRPVAGGAQESIFQPSFSPAGVLTFVSDASGWWNLYQLGDSGPLPLCPREAEFGRPQWVFALSTYAYVDESTLLCVFSSKDGDRLGELELGSSRLRDLNTPFSAIHGLRVEGDEACFIGAAPGMPPAVCTRRHADGRIREVRRSLPFALDPAALSLPEAIEFPAAGGNSAHAFFYRPAHPGVAAPAGQRPPLVVKSHGGPSGAATSALDLRTQYWTSRGIAVVDVNYGGSTGYGRAYRERLAGNWGVVDVADCITAARFLAERGEVDEERLAISGGSAGGYTTLCALTFHDVFRAGASHYGIGDLEALARDTHKFESRYLDRLVGPYPERRDLYVERSPVHFADRLRCPVIFFQGLEDRVVPPSQAEAMVAALARRGVPHAYVAFEGEQHGFRRAENIRTALDGELYFYAHVFGFEVDVQPAAVRIVE